MSTSVCNGKTTRPQHRKPAVALYRVSDDKHDSLPTPRAWNSFLALSVPPVSSR
jgi:hypothetical protein